MQQSPLIFEWQDKETDAKGWVVFDRVINDVAGGGIFMHAGATVQEVATVARNMSRKFTVTDPQIGGAKAGIRFDHQDPRAKQVLRRFILYNAFLLLNHWVTAGDLNTDDNFIESVIKQDLGLSCCQSYLGKAIAKQMPLNGKDRCALLSRIIPMPASPFFPLIEGAVGYGLAVAIAEAITVTTGAQPTGEHRVVIQGFGAVGSSLAYYLMTRKIAQVVAIADKDGFIQCPKGLPILEILQQRTAKAADPRYGKNCLINLTDDQLSRWNVRRVQEYDSAEAFTVALARIECDVFCPCAMRYSITPPVAEALNNNCRMFVSGANNPYGKPGGKEEDVLQQVLAVLEQRRICIVPDWIANSGTAQLFHRALSLDFDLDKDPHCADRILEACSLPIQTYIHNALSRVKNNPLHLHRGAEKLAAERLNSPLPMGSTPTQHRYALSTLRSLAPVEDRVKACLSVAEECTTENELRSLLSRVPNPVAYDGFEPSGRMHIAQGLLKAKIVNTLTDAGFTFILWVADWFALLNHKMGGNLEAIQTVGKYFIEVWKASGMRMDRVRFLWASEEFSKHSDEYWARVLDISTKHTITRVKRSCTIMGRKESDELHASQLFYVCMQVADIFFLGADVCQLGLDQRKVNMLAREYAPSADCTPPIILSHPMLPGLKKGQEKMSKSNPDSAIFMEDAAEDVARKITTAFCPPAEEMKDEKKPVVNPVLEYYKAIVFGLVRPVVRVGQVDFILYEDLHKSYLAGQVSPQELKHSLILHLNELLEPVRRHFVQDAKASNLFEQVKILQEQYNKVK